jgi:hypothetical protein
LRLFHGFAPLNFFSAVLFCNHHGANIPSLQP